ncbi:MAG: acyl-CoA thioesterase [Planctomycetes bacterium]|nr:acyl-CoA thioesterase [Planctomycetota bacterium]
MTIPERLTVAHVHELRVRFCETDQMGVAHHGSYVPWIEEARTEWMRAKGRTYRSMEESGLSLAVTRLGVRYLVSARYDDLIRIETRLVSIRMASLDFEYELHRVEDESGGSDRCVLVAQANTRLALIGQDGRPRRLPEDLFERVDVAGPVSGMELREDTA